MVNWISQARGATAASRRRAQQQLGARPRTAASSTSMGGDSLLELMMQLSGQLGGGSGRPSASAEFAQRSAADKRAANVAHQRQLEYQKRQEAYQKSTQLGQQDYQKRLAAWQSQVAQQNAIYLQKKQQWFARQQAETARRHQIAQRAKALEHERQLGVSELLQGRQERYAQMAPQDAIRATMFGLGLGQGQEGFRTRAKYLKTTLDPLAGARETATGQESALSKLLGGRKVSIGKYGVMGLGGAQQAARAYQQRGAGARSLLGSAFGVGSTYAGEAPGMSRERLEELVGEVTPTGRMY